MRVTKGEPRTVQFTRSTAYEMDPRGHFAVEHAYVQFFVPENRNDEPPVVLVHGGGMSGSCWETTPDGRPGWLHLLLDRGYEVHVVDNVERGRAGFVPEIWDGAPMLRSLEEAWTLFRIGPRSGFATRSAFPNQRFPVSCFDQMARSFVPRWTSTAPQQASALIAVLEKTGAAAVICHSQGGETTFDALAQRPELISRIIALEPSGFPSDVRQLCKTPLTLCSGDFLNTEDHWHIRKMAWAHLAQSKDLVRHICSDEIGGGNSHMLMMDNNSEALLDAALGL